MRAWRTPIFFLISRDNLVCACQKSIKRKGMATLGALVTRPCLSVRVPRCTSRQSKFNSTNSHLLNNYEFLPTGPGLAGRRHHPRPKPSEDPPMQIFIADDSVHRGRCRCPLDSLRPMDTKAPTAPIARHCYHRRRARAADRHG
jgi:hypothetical protein